MVIKFLKIVFFGTRFEQFENLFNPELLISFEDLETNSTASKQLRKQESYEDVNFNYSLSYDLRNRKFRPSSGNVTPFSKIANDFWQ